jgi:hypothetical protein
MGQVVRDWSISAAKCVTMLATSSGAKANRQGNSFRFCVFMVFRMSPDLNNWPRQLGGQPGYRVVMFHMRNKIP